MVKQSRLFIGAVKREAMKLQVIEGRQLTVAIAGP